MSNDEKVQEVLNTVIDRGYYAAKGTQGMCWAGVDALRAWVIEYDQWELLRDAINEYVGSGHYLAHRLDEAGLLDLNEYADVEEAKVACLPIYRDWANRPNLAKRV